MFRDFTLSVFQHLLEASANSGYQFQTFEEFLTDPSDRTIILRHDVDRRSANALDMALLEHALQIKSSYYFRIVKGSNQPNVINRIVELGHEIGYHYEDLALAKGSYDLAIKSFDQNLNYFRKFYPVRTICMHGSPLSKIDNRLIWSKYNYGQFGIIGEPYFDLNFNQVLYLTDTGRRWNGDKVSLRDKVSSSFAFDCRSSTDLAKLIERQKLPDRIMITTHPERWNTPMRPWVNQWVMQNVKNLAKKAIVKRQTLKSSYQVVEINRYESPYR